MFGMRLIQDFNDAVRTFYQNVTRDKTHLIVFLFSLKIIQNIFRLSLDIILIFLSVCLSTLTKMGKGETDIF